MSNSNTQSKPSLKERSYLFSISLVRALRKIPRDTLSAPFINQLIRCGTSMGANIAEAQGANSKKDFAKFYDISLKSGHETIYWLMLFKDALEIKLAEIDILIDEASSLTRMIAASLLTMRNKR